MIPVSFDCSAENVRTIHEIARRAVILGREQQREYDLMDLEMDITACHCNGCPLDLNKLLYADDFNFAHDVFGIHQRLNRVNGELQDCFVPRCAKPETAQV